MASDVFYLIVPENQQSLDIIRDFYSYAFNKLDRSDIEHPAYKSSLEISRQTAIRRFEEQNKFKVYTSAHSAISDEMDWSEITSIMNEEEPEHYVASNDALSKLINELRKQKQEIASIGGHGRPGGIQYTGKEWEEHVRSLEISVKALIEYAQSENFSVGLNR